MKSFHLPSIFLPPPPLPRLHAPSESQPRNRPDQLLYQVLPPGSACKSKDAINRSLIAILSRTFNIQFLTGKGPPRMASIPSPLLSPPLLLSIFFKPGPRRVISLPDTTNRFPASFVPSPPSKSINFPSSQFPGGGLKNCFRFFWLVGSFEDLLNALSVSLFFVIVTDVASFDRVFYSAAI